MSGYNLFELKQANTTFVCQMNVGHIVIFLLTAKITKLLH